MNKFLKKAFIEANKALLIDDVPVGAVIVKNGKIIGKGYNNRVITKKTISHAEINAIIKSNKKTGDWRLDDCEMYVTLKPCLMCQNVIKEARIKKVYYSIENNKMNEDFDLITNMEKIDCLTVENSEMLKKFFKNKRK